MIKEGGTHLTQTMVAQKLEAEGAQKLTSYPTEQDMIDALPNGAIIIRPGHVQQIIQLSSFFTSDFVDVENYRGKRETFGLIPWNDLLTDEKRHTFCTSPADQYFVFDAIEQQIGQYSTRMYLQSYRDFADQALPYMHRMLGQCSQIRLFMDQVQANGIIKTDDQLLANLKLLREALKKVNPVNEALLSSLTIAIENFKAPISSIEKALTREFGPKEFDGSRKIDLFLEQNALESVEQLEVSHLQALTKEIRRDHLLIVLGKK